MKKILLPIVMALSFFSCHAQITQVNDMKEVFDAIQKLDRSIEYLGFHYLGAQEYPSEVIREEEFESRWQKLASQSKEIN